jgi:hypothetical protein
MIFFDASNPSIPGTEYHDIIIEDPVLTGHGFTKFRLPVNGNALRMIVDNCKDASLKTYPNFDKHDINKSVKFLEDQLLDEKKIEKGTVEALVSNFRNECILVSEDPNNDFFKNRNGNGNVKAEQKKKEKESESAAQKLLKLTQDQCEELFLDQFGTPYAAVKIGEHIETLALKDSRFRNWLCRIYYTSEYNVLNSETVSNVLNILKPKQNLKVLQETLVYVLQACKRNLLRFIMI